MVWCVQNQSHRRCCTATAFRRAGGDLQAKRVAGGTRLGHAYLPLESEESRKRCAPAQTVFGRSKANRKRPQAADQAASHQIRHAGKAGRNGAKKAAKQKGTDGTGTTKDANHTKTNCRKKHSRKGAKARRTQIIDRCASFAAWRLCVSSTTHITREPATGFYIVSATGSQNSRRSCGPLIASEAT